MMSLLTGFVVGILTFPGIVVHELAHQFFCYYFRIPVFKVCYFRFGNPVGYVIHEPPRSPWIGLQIAIGPLLVNTVLGLVIGFPAVMGMFTFDSTVRTCFDLFLIWLGISIAMHAFPSIGDARSIWKSVASVRNNVLFKMAAVPCVIFIYLGAAASFLWMDAVYGIFVVVGIPYLFVHVLASFLAF